MTENYKKIQPILFKTKNGREVLVRPVKLSDVEVLCKYINELSKEDTYITFSGEQMTIEDEKAYLASAIEGMEKGNKLNLVAEYEGKIVASTTLDRNLIGKKRTHHRAMFGISVAKDFRGSGIGEFIAREIIRQSNKVIDGLKIIVLSVYAPNEKAINLYKKIGFVEFGRLKKGLLYKGEYIDSIQMCLYIEE